MAKVVGLEDLLKSEKFGDEVKKLDFEQSMKLLEELVSGVERGSLPLEKAILSYEKGVGLVEHIRGLLSGAEEKLKVLKQNSDKSFSVAEKKV